MKTIVIFACLLVATNAISKDLIGKFVAKIKDFGGKCIEETNASPDDINILLSHKLPDSHEGKCLLFCIHKAFSIQNDDGSLSMEGGLKTLEPLKDDDPEAYEKMRKIGVTCATQAAKDDDPCIFAANLGSCMVQEGKAAGFSSDMFEI